MQHIQEAKLGIQPGFNHLFNYMEMHVPSQIMTDFLIFFNVFELCFAI